MLKFAIIKKHLPNKVKSWNRFSVLDTSSLIACIDFLIHNGFENNFRMNMRQAFNFLLSRFSIILCWLSQPIQLTEPTT